MSKSLRNKKKNICPLEEFKDIVCGSKSINEIREKLILRKYDNHSVCSIVKRISFENINIDHLCGKSWRKNFFDSSNLRDDNYISSSRCLNILVKMRGHICECCGLDSWLGRSIPLEVHHIDGNKKNNDNSNLVLLCPNCHSLTDNFRGRNINKNSTYISDNEFAKSLRKSKNVRQALLKLNLSPKGGNYRRAYEIATKYGIKHILEH